MVDLSEGGFSFSFVFTLQGPLEKRNELGIMFRHAYSLTAVQRVRLSFDASLRRFTFGQSEGLGLKKTLCPEMSL